MKLYRLMLAAAAAAVLAGCQTEGGGGSFARQQTGVEGDWISTDGVAISRFNSGTFETFATDTGNKLAQGTYRQRDARTIDITLRSLIRQTTSSVACSMVNQRQLNCTSDSGSQFVLVRRSVS